MTTADAVIAAEKKEIEEKKKAELLKKSQSLEDKIKEKMKAFLLKKAQNENIEQDIAENVDYMTLEIPKINIVSVGKTQTVYNGNRIHEMIA